MASMSLKMTQEELNRVTGRDLVRWIYFSILWWHWIGVLTGIGATLSMVLRFGASGTYEEGMLHLTVEGLRSLSGVRRSGTVQQEGAYGGGERVWPLLQCIVNNWSINTHSNLYHWISRCLKHLAKQDA